MHPAPSEIMYSNNNDCFNPIISHLPSPYIYVYIYTLYPIPTREHVQLSQLETTARCCAVLSDSSKYGRHTSVLTLSHVFRRSQDARTIYMYISNARLTTRTSVYVRHGLPPVETAVGKPSNCSSGGPPTRYRLTFVVFAPRSKSTIRKPLLFRYATFSSD